MNYKYDANGRIIDEGGVLNTKASIPGQASVSAPDLNSLAQSNVTGSIDIAKSGMKGAKFGAAMNMISGMGKSIGQAAGGYKYEKTGLTQAGDQMFDTAADTVMAINPLVGGIMKAGGFLSDALITPLGGTKANATKMDQLGSSKLMSLLPISLINSFTAKKLDTQVNTNQDILKSTSYAGTSSKMQEAADRSTKYYGGLFSKKARRRDEGKNREALQQINTTAGILDTAEKGKKRLTSSLDTINTRKQMETTGGFSNNIAFGRDGFKFTAWYREHKEETILKFQKGGKIGEMNIIPEGKLHKELHHIELDIPISTKGIPVVAKKEGGKLKQTAEIEREELILRKEVTDRLEELCKEGTDEAAIEAGKLLVKEILHNTIDKCKLIKSVE